MPKLFLSGDEALAYGIRLAKPDVIAAYPITPQTIVVEQLSEMVESGSLDSEFIQVESEHSALSCAIGASAVGVRTFTATSSQGLLYMAECLYYAAGGRFPIVMMNANRSTALPWNIYGDQRDSISLLDCGFIQVYAKDAQESLDLALMSYYIAEDSSVSTPYMVNLDGFILTHTYETVEVPTSQQADEFLKPYQTQNCMDVNVPRNLGFSVGPDYNDIFKYKEHIGLLHARTVIMQAEKEFERIFGRRYTGLIEPYYTEDADYILITLGSIAGLCQTVVDQLRSEKKRVGLIRLRYLRPFPSKELQEQLKNAKAIGVLEKDISFGNEGTVYTNVNSALLNENPRLQSYNFIGGLGGKNITKEDIYEIYNQIEQGTKRVTFLGLKEEY